MNYTTIYFCGYLTIGMNFNDNQQREVVSLHIQHRTKRSRLVAALPGFVEVELEDVDEGVQNEGEIVRVTSS